MDDLQPWEIKIDLTLQTTVDAIDEEQDSISVSIPNLFLLLPQILVSFKTISQMLGFLNRPLFTLVVGSLLCLTRLSWI